MKFDEWIESETNTCLCSIINLHVYNYLMM